MQPQSEINSKCKFKSLQQQQQLPTTPTSRNTTTRTTASATVLQQTPTTATAAAAHDITKRSPAVKVVKCKKPLCHFKFYLDIRDHQLTKRIEEYIKLLGGSQEFFLTSNVTHFVTDKPSVATANKNINNYSSCPGTPQTPQTPLTPQTPYSLDCLADSSKPNNGLAITNKKPIRTSRADAILNRARRQSTINVSTPTSSHHLSKRSVLEQASSVTPLKHNDSLAYNATDTSYVVWQCENALRFFKKVQHELKDYLDHTGKSNIKTYAVEPISLKGGYIKFESVKRNYRPYYHLFKKPQEWPKIQLSREDGAFRLSPKKDLPAKDFEDIEKNRQTFNDAAFVDNMTRKSRTKSSQNHNLKNKNNDIIKSETNSQKQSTKCKNQTPQQQKDSSDKQCGVCEICKIEYDALTIHLKTKDHEYFAKNSQNFMALDSLIHSSADVNKFLDENRKLEIKTELEEMEVDHDGLMVIEQDPLQNSDNDKDDEDGDEEEEDYDNESQKSSSTNKRKSVEPKMFSPTLREKSKRSTKGKHYSEKFQNCTLSKSPKTPSPQKPLAVLDLKTSLGRKKSSSTAVISPPIRAMLPPNSLYKVVETNTDVNCTPPRGKSLVHGLNDDSKVVGSPSIIVKFKKVRTTELQVLNGEAENFMFPKKRSDSSDLPTDIDRHTTSDRIQPTQSSQQILSSSYSSSSSEEQDNDEDFEIKRTPPQLAHNGKKAIVKAKRRLSKVCSSSSSKSTLGVEFKQSFPKTPIQPNEQLKSQTKSTTTTTKRKSLQFTQNQSVKTQNIAAAVSVSNKILLPEATRKSSRTATAIVTAATTSTRLLQAAVEAAKSRHKLETSIKSKLPLPPTSAIYYKTPKKMQIKQELKNDSEPEAIDMEDDGFDDLNKNISKSKKKLRCRRRSVVKMEDRMGDANKMSLKSLNQKKLIHGFDVDDYEDDDITIDDDEDDDERDEDFVIEIAKGKTKTSTQCGNTRKSTAIASTKPAAAKSSTKVKSSKKIPKQLNQSMREERLARRQSRLITQLQLELQTAGDEDQEKSVTKTKIIEKKTEKFTVEKTPKKAPKKQTKPETSPKKSPIKVISSIKQETSPPSRYFDYTKSERLKSIRYAFERLPDADLWYRVYKRQDNCEEKYFEYFGSTKYRKLPYELGPIPFETTLFDHNKTKVCCKLCQDVQVRKENEKTQKLHVRRDLKIDLKSDSNGGLNTNSLESQEVHNYSSFTVHDKQQEQINTSQKQDQEHSKSNCSSSNNTETKSYAHKHKKLHLLQRYRQELEQQEQMQRQKLEEQGKSAKNDSKVFVSGTKEIKTEAVNQDCLPSRLDRAGSTHSNASSCCSSTNAQMERKWKKMGAKLAKLSMLANLELPPRKSPREHASTLALVSCIIKQRQDSLSKPNSEIDEPPSTPIESESKVLTIAAEQLEVSDAIGKEPPKTPPPSAIKTSVEYPASNIINSPRTRSQAGTPIEELRFATEISETVKRMRRGRNKYDYSPPFVQRTVGRPRAGRGRGRGGSNSVVNLFSIGHQAPSTTTTLESLTQQRLNISNNNQQPHSTGTSESRGRRRRGRQKGYNTVTRNPENILASIRKTGSKKGVLEFDVDNVAMEALKKATTNYVNPKVLEWQIDKFLSFTNKEYENDFLTTNNVTPAVDHVDEQQVLEDEEIEDQELQENVKIFNNIPAINVNTPPATDYFSSDFDLCDLINQSSECLQEQNDNSCHLNRRSKKFSIFNTVHMNKYYRKRKNPKSNRTGWPKVTKKKAITRQQSMQDKIYFLQNGNIREEHCKNKISIKEEAIDDNMDLDEDESTQEQETRESGVITPPNSENEMEGNVKLPRERRNKAVEDDEESQLIEEDSQIDLNDDSQTANDDDDDEEEDEDEDVLVARERVMEEDNETYQDFIGDEDEEEFEREQKLDSEADADVEEADDDEERRARSEHNQQKNMDLNKKINKKCKKVIPKIIENDDEDSYEPQEKRPRCLQESPLEKMRTNLLNPNSALTSTPTITPFMRAMRRTPQLNGSLGSCISPSEKAGDNSDIFTVSSDGLDTDMDLSNSHSQLRTTTNVNIEDDDHPHHHYTSLQNNSGAATITGTPKRKFDISKYAPTNAATCAAEAATAAVKSLAISQFLKKEVRVTCRRLRAPFRRFRYRR